DEDGIGAILSPQPARAEARPRPAGFFFSLGDADLGAKAAAAFENAQNIAGLRYFEARQRIEIGKHAFEAHLVLAGRRPGLQALRRAVHAVAFAVARLLVRKCAVVVQSGAPQHTAVCHHAGAVLRDFVLMAIAATEVGDTQIAGIDEADEFGRFVVEQSVGTNRIGRRAPGVGKAWMNVGVFLDVGGRVAAVAVDATQVDGPFVVRVGGILVALNAAGAFDIRLAFGLFAQIDAPRLRCFLAAG